MRTYNPVIFYKTTNTYVKVRGYGPNIINKGAFIMKPQNTTNKKAGGFKNSKQPNKFNSSKKDNTGGKKDFHKKPTFKKVQIPIAYSDFYASKIDSLYNLLDQITFDLIAIPVKMNKSEFSGDDSLRGNMIVGTVVKFNNDNTLTISMSEEYAGHVTKDMVVGIRCRKDYTTDEVNYISEFTITSKYESIDAHYKDISDSFNDGDAEDTATSD